MLRSLHHQCVPHCYINDRNESERISLHVVAFHQRPKAKVKSIRQHSLIFTAFPTCPTYQTNRYKIELNQRTAASQPICLVMHFYRTVLWAHQATFQIVCILYTHPMYILYIIYIIYRQMLNIYNLHISYQSSE